MLESVYIHTGPNCRPVRLHTREWSPNIVMAKNSSHPLLLKPLLVCVWCWSCVVTPSHHCLCVCGDATVKNILHWQLHGRRAHTVTVRGAWIQRVLLLGCIPITLLVAVWKCIPSTYNKIEVGCKKGWPCHTDNQSHASWVPLQASFGDWPVPCRSTGAPSLMFAQQNCLVMYFSKCVFIITWHVSVYRRTEYIGFVTVPGFRNPVGVLGPVSDRWKRWL